MQEAIDRVMNTFAMIANLSETQEQSLRQAVTAHLANSQETDANALAIEGLRFAREARI